MLWEKKALAARGSGSSSENKPKKAKKYEKQVYYGSPLDPEAFAVAEANRAAAAAARNNTVFSDLKAFLSAPKARLKLDPQNHLYFLHDPGKHVASAITIKNIRKTHVAFKFRTTNPSHCFMRPNGGVLPPNESIIAIVTKYIEKLDPIRMDQERKTKDKFKIISLPVQPDVDYYPDMFEDDEDNVLVERILQVVYLDPKKASSEQVSRLQRRLAEAEAAEAARKKAQAEEEKEKEKEEDLQAIAPVQEGQGNVINEWKQRREAFLAQQQAGGGKPL